jgi:hypothetical protein
MGEPRFHACEGASDRRLPGGAGGDRGGTPWLLPEGLAHLVPRSHYAAIGLAFICLLSIEAVEPVFGRAGSVSRAVGKQFEIFSDAAGALAIFAVPVFYYRTLRHTPFARDEAETAGFICAKKAVSLLLLAAFTVLGAVHALAALRSETAGDFFATICTMLVFRDILIVLVSLRYSSSYPVVFRNSGFALPTVVLRLAMAAPDYCNAALGTGAAVYLLALNAAYNLFGRPPAAGDGDRRS